VIAERESVKLAMEFDYKQATKIIRKEELRGNNPIPDILSFLHLKPLYEGKLFEILNQQFSDYETGRKNPDPLLRIDVPKPNFTIRPMSRPENKDWILYEAITEYIAKKILENNDEDICKRSYSFLNFKQTTRKDNNWIKFDDKCRELYTLGYKYSVAADLTGLSPFSESLIPKPLPGIIDNGLTDKLAMWFESRQPFLLARLSIERPKSRDKDKDYLKRMKIQCVESLKVSYHIQDREISTRLEDAFLENLDDEQSILYLSSKIIILPFPECRDLISHIAKNLEYWLDAPYKDAFKSILSCKDDYLLKELEEAHISSDLIEECKRSLEEKREVKIYRESETTAEEPIKMRDHEEGSEDKSIFERQGSTRDAVRSQEEPSSKFKNGEISGAETQPEYIGSELDLVSESNGGGGGSGGEERDHATERDRKVTGERGEDILFKYLKNSLQNFGFDANCKLLHKSKVDPHSIYDIEVIDNMKGVFYLEVKSTSSNRPTLSFEMSYRQWKFAREKQDRYQLWFVFDIAGNRPKISGPHKPLVLESQGKLKKTPKEEIVYSCKVKLKG
jgi:hypothetical protein